MQDGSTDFEFLPIDVSLGRCLRYFEKGTQARICGLKDDISGQRMMTYFLTVTKRTTPTITLFDNVDNSGKLSTIDQGGTPTNNITSDLIISDTNTVQVFKNGAISGLIFRLNADSEL